MVDVDVQVNQWADIKKLMAKMSEMDTKLDEIKRQPRDRIRSDDDDAITNDNTKKIFEKVDPSSEAKKGYCSNVSSNPKIDIHLRWRKQSKDHGIRFVLH